MADRAWARGLQKYPEQPTTPTKRAAKFLRLMMDRYVHDRATVLEVTRAIEVWTTAIGEEASGK